MKPKDAFDQTMARVDQLLQLYRLVCDTRSRKVRTDWANKFKNLMHWPKNETIHRVDGEHAILVLREASGLDRSHFCKENLGEILRAALVFTVSALDRFCHDLLLPRAMKMLRKNANSWPNEFKKLSLPLPDIKSAIEHAKKRKGKGGHRRTRPMTIIRAALQDQFHRDLTLQKPNDIAQAFSMVGVKNLWTKCKEKMNEEPVNIERRLNRIVRRRNQIVHEGDLVRKQKAKKHTLNSITEKDVKDDVDWIRRLAEAINGVVEAL